MSEPLVAILTDFGGQDPFVGIMKGVIAGINPAAGTIDLTHEIPPGDILRAAVQLWQAAPYFPTGTVFLAVVDPGVGSPRRGMLTRAGGHFFIGPDNGVFSFILGEHPEVWELTNVNFQLQGASATFHGRDIFAPAAAYCTLGHFTAEFGPRIPDPVRLTSPVLRISEENRLEGEILYPDRFGNLLTSLGRFTNTGNKTFSAGFSSWLPGAETPTREINLAGATLTLPTGKSLPMAGTFSEIPPGECAGVVGSSGLIEIAADGGSAAEILQVPRGTLVSLAWRSLST